MSEGFIEIEAPDGTIVEFPDGTPEAEITNVMRSSFGGPEEAAPAAPSPPEHKKPGIWQRLKSAGRAAVDQFNQGTTFGWGENITDGVGNAIASAIVSGGNPAEAVRIFKDIAPEAAESTQNQLEEQRREHDIISPIANIAGAVPGSIVAGGAAAGLPGVGRGVQALRQLVGNAGTNIAIGAAAGAPAASVTAAGMARDGDRVSAAREAALPGAMGGAAFAAAAPIVSNVARNTLGPLSQKAAAFVQRKSAARQRIEQQLLARPDLPDMIRTGRERFATARGMGVPITLGEAVDDDALRAAAAALKGRPETTGRMKQFFDGRAAQVPTAIDTMIEDISPGLQTADEAGRELIDAAQGKIDTNVGAMRRQADDYFERAKEGSIAGDHPVLQRFTIQKAIKAARKEFPDDLPSPEIPKGPKGEDLPKAVVDQLIRTGQIKGGVPDTSIRVLHPAKMQLDKMIKLAEEDGDEYAIRYLTQAKNELLDAMQSVSDDYKQGMDIYRDQMPEIDRLKQTRVGDLTRLRANGAERATAKVFEGSPTATRAMISDLGPDVTRKAGAGELRRIADENKNNPVTFPNKVLGTTPSKANQERWEAVLGPKYEPFMKKMDVLQQASRSESFNAGSRTQPLLKADEQLNGGARKESADSFKYGDMINPIGFIGKLARKAGYALRDPDAEAKFLNDFADYLTTAKGEELLGMLEKAKSPAAKRIATNNLQKDFAKAITGASSAAALDKPYEITVPVPGIKSTDPNN